MAVTWPTDTGFPQRPQEQGYDEEASDPTVRSDTDLGPPETYLKATKGMAHFVCVYQLDTVALKTRMQQFWANASTDSPAGCKYGTTQITWPDPRLSSGTVTATMVAPPRYTPRGGVAWLVTVVMVVLE